MTKEALSGTSWHGIFQEHPITFPLFSSVHFLCLLWGIILQLFKLLRLESLMYSSFLLFFFISPYFQWVCDFYQLYIPSDSPIYPFLPVTMPNALVLTLLISFWTLAFYQASCFWSFTLPIHPLHFPQIYLCETEFWSCCYCKNYLTSLNVHTHGIKTKILQGFH